MKITLEEKKSVARQNYINARNAWNESRSPENFGGDKELWIAFCDAKRICRLFGVII